MIRRRCKLLLALKHTLSILQLDFLVSAMIWCLHNCMSAVIRLLEKLLPNSFLLVKCRYWQYDICSSHNAVCLSPQLYWRGDWGLLTISPLVPTWAQIITELKGSLSSLKMVVHHKNVQSLNGACVKMVGVQSGPVSHSMQYSVRLYCSDPSRVKFFHSHEDGYVIISRPLRSLPALSHGSESCWRFWSGIKA